MQNKKLTIVILGAGITGLIAGYYLSKEYNVIIFEKEGFIGGTAGSFHYKDFKLDYGPHKIYTELPGIIEEIQKICPLIKVKKKNSIYLNNTYFDFPLKMSQIATKMPITALKAGMDIISKPLNHLKDDSYENYLINRFGKTLYSLSFKDYAYKIWGSNPQELDAELARRRVAISGIFELIKSVLFKDTKKISAEYFYYPKFGMNELIKELAKKINENNGKIIINKEIDEIKAKGGKIDYIRFGKNKIKPDYIISTIPLDSLNNITNIDDSKNEIEKIDYQNLKIIYFLLNKEKALNDCWIFFPEKKLIFQRVSEQKAFSKDTCPEGKTAIMVETTAELNKEVLNRIISQLEEAKIISPSDIEEYFLKTLEKAYPIYKKGIMPQINDLIAKFESINNFYLLGRQGLFNYNNMDQCWDMAMKLAEQIKQGKSKTDWQETKKYFDSYRIVD